ncbi:MAG: VanZ family protein [Alcaligenaceae bacterium]|nr:VanZ family protein [Alcaligenaceae bacterium]
MKKKSFFVLLLLVWLGIIFMTSNQTGRESHRLSQFFAELFYLSGGHTKEHLLFRKFAHAAEYFLLFLLIFMTWTRMSPPTKNSSFVYSILLSYLFACSDELHQYFIRGRGASFRDTLIDLSGILVAALICFIIFKIKNSRQKKIST